MYALPIATNSRSYYQFSCRLKGRLFEFKITKELIHMHHIGCYIRLQMILIHLNQVIYGVKEIYIRKKLQVLG